MTSFKKIKTNYDILVKPMLEKICTERLDFNVLALDSTLFFKTKLSINQAIDFLEKNIQDIRKLVDMAKISDERYIVYNAKTSKAILDFFEECEEAYNKLLEISSQLCEKEPKEFFRQSTEPEKIDSDAALAQKQSEALAELAAAKQKDKLLEDSLRRMQEEKAAKASLEENARSVKREEYEKGLKAKEERIRLVALASTASKGDEKKEMAERDDGIRGDVRRLDGFEAAVAAFRAGVTADVFFTGIRALTALMENIVSEPVDESYRRLRVSNEALRRDLTSNEDGEGCLEAAGFRKKTFDLGEGSELCYFMEEPDVLQPDLWCDWFEGLKEKLEFLLSVNRLIVS